MEKYLKSHCTQASEALEWIEKQTHIRTNHGRMLTGPVQGQFLRMMTQMIQPRRVLEIGTFTGYSAICIASALPRQGHLDTLEVNDELEDLILEGFERAGVSDRVSLELGDAKAWLARQREAVLQGAPKYDMVYIDANKREYPQYYELVFDLVRNGGYILADNVLWDGKVCLSPLPQDAQTQAIARFNDMVTEDPRVESVILPVRDGLNIIRKL